MANALTISACVICKDAAGSIGWTLDSLAWCDEIVVVDSGSKDKTIEICKSHASGKVRVVDEAWRGYNGQREFAASLCKREWVLMLDADEECSPELRREIEGLSEKELADAAVYQMPRKNYVAKRYVRCWSPDFQTRFVHKDRTEWAKQALPEIRTPKSGFKRKQLRQAILHNRNKAVTVQDFCNGRIMEERAVELADAMAGRGRRATFMQLLFRPAMTFLKYYICKGALLDGRFGLAIAYRVAIGVMLKYSVLYERELEKKQR